jgi:hypothetical protein
VPAGAIAVPADAIIMPACLHDYRACCYVTVTDDAIIVPIARLQCLLMRIQCLLLCNIPYWCDYSIICNVIKSADAITMPANAITEPAAMFQSLPMWLYNACCYVHYSALWQFCLQCLLMI